MKTIPFILVLIGTSFCAFAQIHWNEVSDTIELTPKVFRVRGTILLKGGRLNGAIVIDYTANEFYFNDGKASYRLVKDDIQGITLEGYGTFSAPQMFTQGSYDTVLKMYRSRIFPSIDLNTLQFSSSKRTSYSVQNNSISIINEKVLSGKIVAIDPSTIVLIDSDGELHEYQDNDFNYFEFQGKRYFRCNTLYGLYFRDYEKVQRQIVTQWKQRITHLTIEQLLGDKGPFDESVELGNGRKLVVWSDNLEVTSTNTISSTISSSWSWSRGEVQSGNSYSATFSTISTLFMLANSKSYSSGTTTAISSSSTSSNSTASTRTIKVKFGLLLDGQDKVMDVYHVNIFKYPTYGQEFVFANY